MEIKTRSKFQYSEKKDKNLIFIQDLTMGLEPVMSVTNDAENVITKILHEVKWINDKTRFIYTDSSLEVDEIIPVKIDNRICEKVKFNLLDKEEIKKLLTT